MVFKRIKRRRFRRQFKRRFNRRGIRKLKKFVRAKQSKNWRVPRNNLAAQNTFIKVRTQWHVAISNAVNLAYFDLILVANGLDVGLSGGSKYQSPPLWELGTLYSRYHIYKSKVRFEFVDKKETYASITNPAGVLVTEQYCYIYPSVQENQNITTASNWGWSVGTPTGALNNPASTAKCHYKMFTDHEFVFGQKHSCVVKNTQKTKRMFNFPVKENDYTGSIFSHGNVGTATGSQDILAINPTSKWFWHMGVINVDATDDASISAGQAVSGEALITMDTYVRLFAPRTRTQMSEINET